MELLTLTILLIGTYVAVSIWKTASPVVLVSMIIGFLLIVISGYVTYYDTLSRPKDVTYEFLRNDESAQVIAFSVEPGVALYVLLSLTDLDEPRYYRFPWSEGVERMAKALLEGQENNEKMSISKPFEKSLSSERVAHPNPQPKMPDKKPPTNNVIKLEGDGG